MPYIKQEERFLAARWPKGPGQLNYAITEIIKVYLGEAPRYQHFNDAIGALECAKLELYRRMIAPYEDTKIKENGDVYGAKYCPDGCRPGPCVCGRY